MPTFWNEVESLWLSGLPSPTCLAKYSNVLFGDDDCNTQRVQRFAPFEFNVLTMDPFLQTICHDITAQYHGGRIQQKCEERGMVAPLNKCTWT